MEIILKEDINGLGYKDDIVKVKPGYGRNYLMPQGKAILATPSAKKQLAETLRQRAHKIERLQNEAQELAAKLNAVETIAIAMKVSPTGTIYGSVTNLHLAEELKKLGFEIDRKNISVGEVKSLGAYKATVKIYKGISAEIPFEVVAEAAE